MDVDPLRLRSGERHIFDSDAPTSNELFKDMFFLKGGIATDAPL
jgi:hypothetical protein